MSSSVGQSKIFTWNSTWVVIALLCIYAIIWLTQLSHISLSPPVDNLEQLTWMRSLEWGYYKHPPAPTWLLAGLVSVLGWSAMTSYLLGASLTLLSMFFFWDVLRKLRGPHAALLCLLCALCITFYSNRLYYYNHNIVLMFCISASAWLFVKILEKEKLYLWFALAIIAALGMLSKYQFVLIGLVGVWLYIALEMWRNPVHRKGMFLAVLVASLICLPHLYWLFTQDNTPINYAMKSSLGAQMSASKRISWSVLWLLDLVFNRCAPAILLVVITYFWTRKYKVNHQEQDRPYAKLFLLSWGSIPVLAMVLMGLIGGVDLQLQWGTAFALWLVPIIVYVFRIKEESLFKGNVLFKVSVFFIFIQIILLTISYQTSPFGRKPSHHWSEFDSAALAKEVAEPARQAIGGPIRIIAGPRAASAAIALLMPEQPKILISNDLTISPWIKPEELNQAGVIELWAPNTGPSDLKRGPSGWGWKIRTTEELMPE